VILFYLFFFISQAESF